MARNGAINESPSSSYYLPQHDMEAGANGGENVPSDPFDITNTKNASLEMLKRWRVSVFTQSLSPPTTQYIFYNICIRILLSPKCNDGDLVVSIDAVCFGNVAAPFCFFVTFSLGYCIFASLHSRKGNNLE